MNNNYGAFVGGDYDDTAIIIKTQNSNSNHGLKKLTMDATRDDAEMNEKIDIKNMEQLILVYNRRNSELRDKESKLHVIENELQFKMKNVEAMKNSISKKESEVLARENVLKQKEDEFTSKQNDLIKRENDMQNRENRLQQLQKDIEKLLKKTMKEHDLRENDVEVIVKMQRDSNDEQRTMMCPGGEEVLHQEQKEENNILSEECGKYWARINAINEMNSTREINMGGTDQKKKQDTPVAAETKEALNYRILGRFYAEDEMSDRERQFEKKLKELFFKEKYLSQKAQKVDQKQTELNKLEDDIRKREAVIEKNEHLLQTAKELESRERMINERQIELFAMDSSSQNPYRAPSMRNSNTSVSGYGSGSKCSLKNWRLF